MLRALIFDVDGTLAETEDLHRQAFNGAFADLGLPWSWSPARYADLLTVMGGKERLRHYVETEHAGEAKALGPLMGEIHDRKTRRYGDLVEGGSLALRPGVGRLIAEARAAGLKLAVASTTSRPNVDTLLRINFPEGDVPFDVIACGDEAARKKPAPDVFDLALRLRGLGRRHPLGPRCGPAGHRHPQPLHREPPPRRGVLGRLRPRRTRRAASPPLRACLAGRHRDPGRPARLARAHHRLIRIPVDRDRSPHRPGPRLSPAEAASRPAPAACPRRVSETAPRRRPPRARPRSRA